MRIRYFLTLMRPANIVTAIADILAGVSIAGLFYSFSLSHLLLILSTIGLYGGGVVFNDIFDKKLDAEERPERPLPSGKVQVAEAITLGVGLLILGIIAAALVSKASGLLAAGVALLALLYDKYGKHHVLLGPLNMGLCRGGNLLLGVSISLAALHAHWWLAFIPIWFIADITLTSQGEVEGKNRSKLIMALLMDLLVIVFFAAIQLLPHYKLFPALPFLLLWLWMNSASKLAAIRNNQPRLVMKAVKMGVLSLIPLNAAISAGFEGILAGVIVLGLLPISMGLARYFSVT